MKSYIIYGGGSPLRVESYHPEVAEAEACREHGFNVENLVTVELKDGMLLRDGDSECSAGTGLHSDPE